MYVSLGLDAGLSQFTQLLFWVYSHAFMGGKVIFSKMEIYVFSEMETFVYANSLALPPLEFIVVYVDLREDWCLERVGPEIRQPPL